MVSDIGTWVQLIVVGSLVAAHTGSAVQTGLVTLASFMPHGIASPLGGLLADRYDRRKVFATFLMVQAAFTGMLAMALGLGVRNPAVLTVLILFASVAGASGQPSYAAMLPDLVPPEELMAMVSLGVYSWNSGRVIGPLLGTLLALLIGPAWTVGFNAISFVVMAGAVMLVRRSFLPPGSHGSMFERLRVGWRSLRATPGCYHGIALLAILNGTSTPFVGLVPIYARVEFHGGAGLSGALASAQGVGAILGSIAITVLVTRRSRSMLVGRAVFAVSISLVVYALAPTSTVVIGASAALGVACAAMLISSMSIVQRDAPHDSRGRVVSIMQAVMGTSYGIGLLFIGWLGDAVNLRFAFCVGAVSLVLGFGLLVWRSRHWRAAIDGLPARVRPGFGAV